MATRSVVSTAYRLRLLCYRNFLNFHSVRNRSQIQRTGRTLPQKLLDRKKGQHILKNEKLLQKIVDCAQLQQSDVVLEIGSGSGNLTLRILEQCGKLYAVDVDAKMTSILNKRVDKHYQELSSKLHCIVSDVLQFDIPTDIDHIISNVPYQISSELIFKLLSANYFNSAILMFQEEFIQKLVSNKNSKQYSRLSVNAQMHCKIERLFNIDRSNYQPPPNVDSGLVKLTPYNNENNPWLKDVDSKYLHASLLLNNYGKYTSIDQIDQELLNRKLFEYDQWNEYLKICFSQKNKRLPAVFDNILQKSKNRIQSKHGANVVSVFKDLFDGLEMNTHRANGTDITDFLRLYDSMRALDIEFHP